jgi:hypothetical protein
LEVCDSGRDLWPIASTASGKGGKGGEAGKLRRVFHTGFLTANCVGVPKGRFAQSVSFRRIKRPSPTSPYPAGNEVALPVL